MKSIARMTKYLIILFTLFGFVLDSTGQGQGKKPETVEKWGISVSPKEVEVGEIITLRIEADVKETWYMYGTATKCDEYFGPIMTEFTPALDGLEQLEAFKAIGAHMYDDKVFGCTYEKFHEGEKAVFEAKFKAVKEGKASIGGDILCQTCQEGLCLNVKKNFPGQTLTVKKKTSSLVKEDPKPVDSADPKTNVEKFDPSSADCACCDTTLERLDKLEGKLAGFGSANATKVEAAIYGNGCQIERKAGFDDIQVNHVEGDNEVEESLSTLLYFMLISFLAGLAALLTPCVFPMIPMTVTFFTKSGKSRAESLTKAFFYGLSIILIFTFIGVVVARFNGPAFANLLSTHWAVNLLFFSVFFIFALSFLGLFDITLPSGLVNKMDSKADKGGYLGIFFMAFTLVLVSFSCTGPIVGSILILSAGGSWLKPLIGMIGFSSAFAIPFTIFALFPSALNSLPKSGGWLNAVKVTLGLLELALALKFLSKIDLLQGWGLLDRHVFLALWIAIFLVMVLYLFGKIRFPHDSPMEKVGVFRGLLAISTLAFVIYMLPGLWGAPVKMLSGIIPPRHTQDFDVEEIVRQNTTTGNPLCEKPMYNKYFHAAQGINAYYDLRQAICCAREQNKPILLDFTGIGCENCRKIEDNVWADSRVRKLIAENYILLQFYGDAYKIPIPEGEEFKDKEGNVVDNVGDQSTYFLSEFFGRYGQPYYILLGVEDQNDPNSKITLNELTAPINYNQAEEADNYVKFLEDGIKAYYAK